MKNLMMELHLKNDLVEQDCHLKEANIMECTIQ